MNEPNAKLGETKTHEVGGKTLRLAPLTMKKRRQAQDMILAAAEALSKSGAKTVAEIEDEIIANHGVPYARLVCGDESITKEWIDECCTYDFLIAFARESFAINGLPDFFQRAGEKKAEAAGS